MTDILKAIQAINPNAKATVYSEDGENIVWDKGTTPISKADILAKQKQLVIDYNNNAYQRKRQAEYPEIEKQLDDLYHNGIDGWKATIKKVKDKYPKG